MSGTGPITEEMLRAEWRRWFVETDAVDKAFAVRDDEQHEAFLRVAVAEVADPAHLAVTNRIAADVERRVLDRCADELLRRLHAEREQARGSRFDNQATARFMEGWHAAEAIVRHITADWSSSGRVPAGEG